LSKVVSPLAAAGVTEEVSGGIVGAAGKGWWSVVFPTGDGKLVFPVTVAGELGPVGAAGSSVLLRREAGLTVWDFLACFLGLLVDVDARVVFGED
jgi:hypothetical protein